jgi:hypothetical protein
MAGPLYGRTVGVAPPKTAATGSARRLLTAGHRRRTPRPATRPNDSAGWRVEPVEPRDDVMVAALASIYPQRHDPTRPDHLGALCFALAELADWVRVGA